MAPAVKQETLLQKLSSCGKAAVRHGSGLVGNSIRCPCRHFPFDWDRVNGGPARIRTLNPLLRRQMLYPLSYGTTEESPDYSRNRCQCVQRSGLPYLKFSA